MESAIENEYKFLVPKALFERTREYVDAHFERLSDKVQVNYYYDDDLNSLNKLNKTVRVRQVGNRLVLQCKTHRKAAGLLVKSREQSCELASLPRSIVLQDEHCPVTLKGCLVTRRESYFNTGMMKIDMDRNYYLGKCDYEIEIEFDLSMKKNVQALIKQMCLKTQGEAKGKSSRFFERWEDQSYAKSEFTC